MWKVTEIIVNNKVQHDPVTRSFLSQCPGVPVTYVNSGNPKNIKAASQRLNAVAPAAAMLNKIMAGKQVVYIGPAGDAVDVFTIPDDRLLCPHFERLKFASNGCFYRCEWCYLKLTYRSQAPFIRVYAQYHEIKKQILARLGKLQESDPPILFNSGELADSLSLDHLTGAAATFIPWFAQQEKGYLFMLTKSDNVDHIVALPHAGHTIIAWSLNAPSVSAQYEIGAPSFQERLDAARKVQRAGYKLRVRLDPIVPVEGWEQLYAATIQQIFQTINPERITLGTLRFEEQFYNMQDSLVSDSSDLKTYMEGMIPMFEPKVLRAKKERCVKMERRVNLGRALANIASMTRHGLKSSNLSSMRSRNILIFPSPFAKRANPSGISSGSMPLPASVYASWSRQTCRKEDPLQVSSY